MIWILALLLIIMSAIVALLFLEIHQLTLNLEYINSHNTNAELPTQTNWRIFVRLAAAINHSLVQTRDLREAQVRQNQRVHSMLTNLTHDIKTPLTVASGYVQLLQREAPHNPQLARVGHSLSSVSYYLHYLMDFNLIQEQSGALHLEDLNLTQIVEGQLFDAFDQINERQLTLTPNLATNIMLISDRALLLRVIQNLIGNWLKYATGELSVTLDEPDEQYVRLVFANQTSQPITDVDRLAERFYTADPARQNSSGLGLSIVRTIMTQLNGRMTLQAVGTWFYVTLQFHRS